MGLLQAQCEVKLCAIIQLKIEFSLASNNVYPKLKKPYFLQWTIIDKI